MFYTSVSAYGDLNELLAEGAYIFYWEPLVLEECDTGSVILSADKNLEIKLDKSSGIRIDAGNSSLDDIAIYQKYVSVSNPQIFTLVPLTTSQYKAVSGNIIEIPSDVIKERYLILKTIPDSPEIPVKLFRYCTERRPFFWERLLSKAKNDVEKNIFLSEFEQLSEEVEKSDDWSLTGLWVRVLAAAVESAKTSDNATAYLTDALYDITTAFATLSGENTYETKFEMNGSEKDFKEIDSCGLPVKRSYYENISNVSIPVSGPALLKLRIRVQLDDDSNSQLTEIPLSIRLDGVRTGHWPSGICRVIRETADSVSRPVFQMLYIPRGTHSLEFISERQLLLSSKILQPVFSSHHFSNSPYPVKFISQIPVTLINDTGWIQKQFLQTGQNPILTLLGTHYSNRIYWEQIDSNTRSDSFLDPAEKGNIYPLVSGKTANLIVKGRNNNPSGVRLIRILDPDRIAQDKSPKIWIDNQLQPVADLQNPYNAPKEFSIALYPGTYKIKVNSAGRRIYILNPLENTPVIPLISRNYYPLNSVDGQESVFSVSGNHNSGLCRIYYRTDKSNPIDLYLNKHYWKSFLPVHSTYRDSSVFGPVEIAVPPGKNALSFHSKNGDLKISVYQPRWLADSKQDSLVKDPFLETLIKNIDSPEDYPVLLQKLMMKDLTVPEKVLWLSLAGDCFAARDLFLISEFNSSLVSHRMLLAWVYAHTGMNSRALETAWKVITDDELPYCDRFMSKMLDAAFTLGSKYKAIVIAERMLQHNSSNSRIHELIKNVKDHHRIYSDVSLEQLARSQSPRFLSIPDTEIISTGIKLAQSNGSDYWLLSNTESSAGSTIKLKINQPGLIRIALRSPILETSEYHRSVANLLITSNEINTKISINLISGQLNELIIPVRQAGDVNIECLSGCVSINCKIQVPGLIDFYAPSIDVPLIDEYIDILNSRTTQSDLYSVYAALQKLMTRDSDFYPVESLISVLKRSTKWKFLSGWPENYPDKQYLAFTSIDHDPVVEIRALNIKDPDITAKTHLLTSGSKIYFDPSEFDSGEIICSASGMDNMNYSLQVEIDRRALGKLTPVSPVLKIPWRAGTGQRIRIYATLVQGSYPVKLTVICNRSGLSTSVPVYGSKRYIKLMPNNSASISGRILGPACVRLKLRSENPSPQANSVAVKAYNVKGEYIWDQILELPIELDNNCLTKPTKKSVSIPLEVIIPFPENRIHQLTVTNVSCKSPVLIRASALMESMEINENTDLCNRTDSIITDRDQEMSAEVFDVSEEQLPENKGYIQWNPHAESYYFSRSSRLGTWGLSLGYNDRDRNNLDDSGDVYASDGFKSKISWNKRIDSGKGLHRFYFDTVAGATSPSEEPKGMIGHFRGAATWHIGRSGFRTRLNLSTTFQSYDAERLSRNKFQFDIRKSLKPGPRLSWLTVLGVYKIDLDSDKIDSMEYKPHPQIYTEFDARHDSGFYLMTKLSVLPTPHISLYIRMRTLTAGDGESGLLGPWWARIGFRSVAGPVIYGVFFEERQTFGTSLEPDRSRINAHLSVCKWLAGSQLWELSIQDRYTFKKQWNDIRATISVKFNSGNLLGDFDPFQLLDHNRIESLAN